MRATLDRADDFEAIRRPMSDEPHFGRTIFSRNATLIEDFRSVCDRLSVEVPTAVIERCERALSDSAVTALTHGDTCPDNVFLTPAGARFIDFEFAGFRHPMLDGVYARVPFATCWCVNRLPPLVVDAFESAYRTALGSPSWFDEAAMDWWLFWLLHTTVWGFDGLEEADEKWGIATRRQRLVLRWGEFADRTDVNVLAAFGGRVRDAVAERWPETEPMPLYPAFR